MKKIVMFSMDTCPYCTRAKKMVQELKNKNPEYKNVDIEVIDEDNRPEEYAHFNHEFVPAYYADGEHIFDGVPTLEIIEGVLKKGLE